MITFLRALALFCATCVSLQCAELTIASYNCGALSEHYDYLRAACMHKVMQERFIAEPEKMALNEKIQAIAFKRFFGTPEEQKLAHAEWHRKGYQRLFEQLTRADSNASWLQKANQIISNYKVRPVVITDPEVEETIQAHLIDLCRGQEDDDQQVLLQKGRAKMAERIFSHHLKFDILCLQEADDVEPLPIPDPDHYDFLFVSQKSHSFNAIAWKKERFEEIGASWDPMGRALVVKLKDKESGKTLLVASGHLSGCNPFQREIDPVTGLSDSQKGDAELQEAIDRLNEEEGDLKLIAMDANVASTHPRLALLHDEGYQMDAENHFEMTCTNPNSLLNTRIDWIALKSQTAAAITNIPVLGIGLNSLETNISDHKPIAAKIEF